MTEADLTQPYHVTADYVGEPGARTFYLQAEDGDTRITLLVEKEQVAGLARVLRGLLAQLDDAPASDWDRDAMALRDPLDPLWRAGEITVGLTTGERRFVIEAVELAGEELVGEEEREPDRVRIWMDRDQARRLAAHAAAVVAEGRPRCRLCGRPLEVGGHVCPASNGHGKLTR